MRQRLSNKAKASYRRRKTKGRGKGRGKTRKQRRAKMHKTPSPQPEPEPMGSLSPRQETEVAQQMKSLKFQPTRMASQVKIMELVNMDILDWILFSKWCAVFISGDIDREYEGNGEVGKAYDIFNEHLDESLRARGIAHSKAEQKDKAAYMKQVVDDLWPIGCWGSEKKGKVYKHAYLKSKNPFRGDRKVKIINWAQAVLAKLKGPIMKDPKAKAAYQVYKDIKMAWANDSIQELVEKESYKTKLKKLDPRPNSILYGDGILAGGLFGDDDDPAEKMHLVEIAFAPILIPLAAVCLVQMVSAVRDGWND